MAMETPSSDSRSIVARAVASLVISVVFYKGFHWNQSLWVIADALKSAGTIMLIVATAIGFGHWMTDSGVPAQLVTWVLDHHLSTW